MVKNIVEILKETTHAIIALLIISLAKAYCDVLLWIYNDKVIPTYVEWDMVKVKYILVFGFVAGINVWFIKKQVKKLKEELREADR